MIRRVNPFLFFGLAALVSLTWSCEKKLSTASAADSIDFNIHIRPILSDRCFKCHGPDANQRKAHLRLDTQEGAYAALKDDSDCACHCSWISG